MIQNLRNLSKEVLAAELKGHGFPAFRANQVYQWLWMHRTLDVDLMTNLPKELKSCLKENYCINQTVVDVIQRSTDGTIKVGFKTYDNYDIEGVIIPKDDRFTACISSQVGCSLACTFCATGFLPRSRNLFAWEIYDQVFLLNLLSEKDFGNKLTNIVYMGMGEPLLNYDEVIQSIRFLNDTKEGLGFGAKRITVSTSGVSRNIIRLADEGLKINLALSLHAPNNDKRTAIMDINKSNPIETVIPALKHFYEKTGNKISFEYVLLSGINDSEQNAKELSALCKDFPVFVNIIEYNPVDEVPYYKSKKEQRDLFLETLRTQGVQTKVRRSRGKDIDAGCGQLANKIIESNSVAKDESI